MDLHCFCPLDLGWHWISRVYVAPFKPITRSFCIIYQAGLIVPQIWFPEKIASECCCLLRAVNGTIYKFSHQYLACQLWFCFTSCFEDIVQSGRIWCTLGEMERPWEQDHRTFSYCGAGKDGAWYITSYAVLLGGMLSCIPQVTWIFSVYTQACIPRNKSDKWDILWYTTREHCVTFLYHVVAVTVNVTCLVYDEKIGCNNIKFTAFLYSD